MKENISVEATLLHAFAERNLPLCHSLVLFLRGRHALPHLGKQLFTTGAPSSREDSCVRKGLMMIGMGKSFSMTVITRRTGNHGPYTF